MVPGQTFGPRWSLPLSYPSVRRLSVLYFVHVVVDVPALLSPWSDTLLVDGVHPEDSGDSTSGTPS